MPEFILIQTIFNLFLALLWTKSNIANLLIKMVFFIMTSTGAYFLLGPRNLIAQLAQ